MARFATWKPKRPGAAGCKVVSVQGKDRLLCWDAKGALKSNKKYKHRGTAGLQGTGARKRRAPKDQTEYVFTIWAKGMEKKTRREIKAPDFHSAMGKYLKETKSVKMPPTARLVYRRKGIPDNDYGL